jgi:hypothetical protein
MGGTNLKAIKTATFVGPNIVGVTGGIATVEWDEYQKAELTLTSHLTDSGDVVFSTPEGLGNFILTVIQDATGGWNIGSDAWPAAVIWPGGIAPTFGDPALGKRLISFYYDGTNWWGQYITQTYS